MAIFWHLTGNNLPAPIAIITTLFSHRRRYTTFLTGLFFVPLVRVEILMWRMKSASKLFWQMEHPKDLGVEVSDGCLRRAFTNAMLDEDK